MLQGVDVLRNLPARIRLALPQFDAIARFSIIARQFTCKLQSSKIADILVVRLKMPLPARLEQLPKLVLSRLKNDWMFLVCRLVRGLDDN
jgi:hypothetical protein